MAIGFLPSRVGVTIYLREESISREKLPHPES
jgi:hypothetical protein